MAQKRTLDEFFAIVDHAKRPRKFPLCNVIWRHPTADARLVEFDLRPWAALIQRTVDACRPKLVSRPPVVVFGKQCHMQREVGFFAKETESYGYDFSGQLFASREPGEDMLELMGLASEWLTTRFNGCLVNCYLDGRDSIGAHSDSEAGISPRGVFAISVGAARRFQLRSKGGKEPVVFETKTKPFHGLLMEGVDFQRVLKHGIPVEKRVLSERTSLTFRQHDKAKEDKIYRAIVARNGQIN